MVHPFSPSRRPAGAAILAAALIAASLPARAADDDQIVTDRPDFVESSNVVGKGHVQIETSMAAERDRAAGVRERSVSTPTLLRYGIGETIELRLETDGWSRQRTTIDTPPSSMRTGGIADTAIGVKWHVRDAQGAAPSLGLLLHADLPSGAADLRGHGVRPSLRLAAEWELPDEFSLGVMPGIASQTGDDSRRFTSGIFGIVLGKEWNARWRSFVELSAPQIARMRDGGTVATADIGAAYLVNGHCQLDAALSRGLNSRTPDLSVTVGLSVKY